MVMIAAPRMHPRISFSLLLFLFSFFDKNGSKETRSRVQDASIQTLLSLLAVV